MFANKAANFPTTGYNSIHFAKTVEQLKTTQQIDIDKALKTFRIKKKNSAFRGFLIPTLLLPIFFTIIWIFYIGFLTVWTVFIKADITLDYQIHWGFQLTELVGVLISILLALIAILRLFRALNKKGDKFSPGWFFILIAAIVIVFYLATVISHIVWAIYFAIWNHWLVAVFNGVFVVVVSLFAIVLFAILVIFMLPQWFGTKSGEKEMESLLDKKAKTNSKVYQNAAKNLRIQNKIVNYVTETLGRNPFDDDTNDVVIEVKNQKDSLPGKNDIYSRPTQI